MKRLILLLCVLGVVGAANAAERELFGLASNYTIQQPKVQSEIDPSLDVFGPVYFQCPTNGEILKFEPEHGVSFMCDGREWVVWGNALYLIGIED